MKDHAIHNGRDASFRVWRGPCNKDFQMNNGRRIIGFQLDNRPQEYDSRIHIQGMMVDAFQQVNEPMSSKEKTMEMVE